MTQIGFFALKEDILPVLQIVESSAPLKYVRTGNFTQNNYESDCETFCCAAEIPHLGTATSDSAIGCEAFLVCDRELPIEIRRLPGIDTNERLLVDQLVNPDTVTFSSGGMWKDILLDGRVATASNSNVSRALMKRFRSAIQKHFAKIRAFYVGPKARELLEHGTRLAGAAQSPREFDLAP